MNYHHFTIEERCCLREYYVKGKSYREIARLLGRNVSSISREIMRNKTFMNAKPAYYPYTAQKKSNLRNSYRHRGMFWKQEVLDYIDEKLSQTWSPEQISKTPCGMKMPSFKTIYRWIDERYLRSTLKNLRRKGKTRKRLGNGGRFTTGKSIRKRDKSVYNRKEFGHWEADTVVSGQGKSKACFATLAERKTRYYIAVKIPDRKGETMAKAVIDALSKFPKEAVKTITCDRGSEFACWREIEKALHCDMYFAVPCVRLHIVGVSEGCAVNFFIVPHEPEIRYKVFPRYQDEISQPQAVQRVRNVSFVLRKIRQETFIDHLRRLVHKIPDRLVMQVECGPVHIGFLADLFHGDVLQILFLQQSYERLIHTQGGLKVFAVKFVYTPPSPHHSADSLISLASCTISNAYFLLPASIRSDN